VVIPLVEETLVVEKRLVLNYSHVTEEPVEEQVRLRDERVRVDRRPVDRAVGPGSPEAFQEASIEVTETTEEPVVAKPARAIEDVVVDVHVQSDFRRHWARAFTGSGLTHEDCAPAYRYGHALGSDTRFTSRDWPAREADARQRWEARNPGTWERFKGSIRYAWDRARGQARAA
jgi:hypothetical protein